MRKGEFFTSKRITQRRELNTVYYARGFWLNLKGMSECWSEPTRQKIRLILNNYKLLANIIVGDNASRYFDNCAP